MAGRIAVPGWIRIFRKRASIGEDLPVLHVAFGQDEHPARDHEYPLVVIVGPDARRVARHAMNVRVLPLLDGSFLYDCGGPWLVRHGSLQRRGEIDELARDLRIPA